MHIASGFTTPYITVPRYVAVQDQAASAQVALGVAAWEVFGTGRILLLPFLEFQNILIFLFWPKIPVVGFYCSL